MKILLKSFKNIKILIIEILFRNFKNKDNN